MDKLASIDLRLAERLKDRSFRREWFRAELEDRVPDMFREMRVSRGLTQDELAPLADMKQSAISRFEKSRDASWKLETLVRLSEALDAQLVISIEPAEKVIARYARDERRSSLPSKSVVDAAPSAAFDSAPQFNSVRKISASSVDRTNRTEIKSMIGVGDRPWN